MLFYAAALQTLNYDWDTLATPSQTPSLVRNAKIGAFSLPRVKRRAFFRAGSASSPWWKSRGSRCERRDGECEAAGGRRCYSIGDERQRSRWRRAAATRWARGGYGRRLCHSSGPMARIATAPRFAPDTRKTLSRDPRDFHHGLLGCASHHLITEVCHRAAILSWRLLAVLNAESTTPLRAQLRTSRTDGLLTHFGSPRGEKGGPQEGRIGSFAPMVAARPSRCARQRCRITCRGGVQSFLVGRFDPCQAIARRGHCTKERTLCSSFRTWPGW